MQSGIETRGNLSTEFGSPMARSGKSRQKDWKELWILFVFKTILWKKKLLNLVLSLFMNNSAK